MVINNKNIGVYWHKNDLGNGSFALRIGGTNEFVSKIDPDDPSCFPPGSIETVSGWSNPNALYFDTLDAAWKAGAQAWNAEGCHISIEVMDAGR
jgi:hypothetical protein